MGYEKKEARRIVRGEDGYFWNPPTPSRDSRLTTPACERARGRGDVARETIAEGERRKRREKERERERMKRDRVKRERMKTWTKRGSHVGDGITKPFIICSHNLDIEKGGATIWT